MKNHKKIEQWLKQFEVLSDKDIEKILQYIGEGKIITCINAIKPEDIKLESTLIDMQTNYYMRKSVYDDLLVVPTEDPHYAPISIDYSKDEAIVIRSSSTFKLGFKKIKNYVTLEKEAPVIDYSQDIIIVKKTSVSTKTLEGNFTRDSYKVVIYNPKEKEVVKYRKKLLREQKVAEKVSKIKSILK